MSLRLRLTLFYTALTTVIVLLVSIAAYAVHSRGQYEDLDLALDSAATHAAAEHVASASGRGALPDPMSPEVDMVLLDQEGRVTATSPGGSSVPPVVPRDVLKRPSGPAFNGIVALAPALGRIDAGSGAFGLVSDQNGDRWRVFVLPAESDQLYLVAAGPLTRVDASAEALLRLDLALTVATAALTFAAGGLMAGRALRPVAVLTEAAGAIARSRVFNRRVPVAERGDELGRLATTFNQMLDSLEQAYRAQQRFVADASHELRAPLTVIQATLELVERKPGMPAVERQEAVREASREARRLARLVSELLALARADAGVALSLQPVELDRVLLEALGEARHLAVAQKIEIGRLDPTLVQGDPDRLKQLLLILLDNALKYTASDGQVTLNLRRNGPHAEVTVRDNGLGITAADLPHVFERFYRAEAAMARDSSGSGLGLPIALWIARQHGGDLTLSSKPSKGTIAIVKLPMSG